ncbi:Glu/Leu/Phe/Val family dehydrogenase [Halomonas sp. NCCP-2165]|nr:Glu/Leu/Phe/Val dehydrogenase dimerization domain-containing protein [Halomonas sp. NCCP-2165]GKW50143.1 leucine dehydrogenase [Halomonas sp. NCCP-2165]
MFDHPDFDHHEQVVYGCDEASGLKAIIAIHNTHLGPALGGLRVFPYASDGEALSDVLRLSRGMSYKSALAGLPLGGGKAVIIADPRRDKTPALMRAMGRLVERLGGRYITAEDSGTSEADMQWIAEETTYVTGLRRSEDESGDPSPFTALGVFHGLQAAVRHGLGRDDLDGVRVAIQGVGSVGAHLAEELGAATLPPEAIFDADVDVFAPCALGGAIDETACRRLRAKVVAGAANNQLATPAAGEALHRRGILYAPDYVTNAGGVIEVAWQRRSDYDRQAVIAQVERIGTTLATIFEGARREGKRPEQVADRLAEERFRPDRPRAA